MKTYTLAFFCLSLARVSQAAAIHDHSHVSRSVIGDSWAHPDDHPVSQMFKRASTDGSSYPAVGSNEWKSAYPGGYQTPDTSKLPKAWVDKLNAAVASGKIPNIPVTKATEGQNPQYPPGTSGTDPAVCSSTLQCRIDGDIWDAPDSVIGIGFDDGPQPPSDKLYAFLRQNNQPATHFFIGDNILQFPNQFLAAFNAGDDLAVHTWSHPYMTSKNNLEVVAELGWTAQLIHHSTGGRAPRYWRPPFGDSDKRVHAIAKEVFGLTAIIWNQDTADWSLTTGGTQLSTIANQFKGWLSGKKSPGLIILEHELSDMSVTAFINAYPTFKAQGWKPISQARIYADPYLNAAYGANSTVTPADIINASNASIVASSSASPTSSGSALTTLSPSSSSSASTGSPSSTPRGSSSAGRSTPSILLLIAVFLLSTL